MYANSVQKTWTLLIGNERATLNCVWALLQCYHKSDKPSFQTTRRTQFEYNPDDSKFEVHDIQAVSSITVNVCCNHINIPTK